LFPHDPKTWRPSAIAGKRFAPYFISTGGEGEQRVIKLHQDGGSSGRPVPRVAERLPRTVLSAVNAVESPTALLARREMQSWRLLQLEPSALREPDEVTAPSSLRANVAHLPATLFRLARTLENNESRGAVCARVANRLSELISDVRRVEIDHDSKRELLTLQVVDANNTRHAARSLSDGTLRFLALSVLEIDPEAQGLLCLEEPENGIHPDRIPAMLRLLQDIAVDVHIAIDEENPLRQVIINTHSPAVVQEVPEDSLLLAELRELVENGRRIKTMRFSALSNTWQTTGPSNGQVGRIMSKGKLIQYLNPASLNSARPGSDSGRERRRVIDRDDSQMLLATLYPDTE
jgi:predicted ATPase